MRKISLYQRGFLIVKRTEYPDIKINDFEKVSINDYDIFYDKYTKFDSVSTEKISVVVIGNILDTMTFTLDTKYILNKICTMFLATKSFLNNINLIDYISYLNGRYLLLIIYKDEMYLLNDACGLRSVYYHTKKSIISSHYNLINRFTNENREYLFEKYLEANKTNSIWCLPGDLSPYTNIRSLICNHVLLLSNHTIKRFWPYKKADISSLDDASCYIAECIEKQIALLVDNFTIFQSLTAGNDSRMSLAASKKYIEKIKFFTFVDSVTGLKSIKFNIADAQNSVNFSRYVAEKFRLDYKSVVLEDQINQDENDILNFNHYHYHVRNLIPNFNRCFMPYDSLNSLHIRTNITEVIRKPYFLEGNNTDGTQLFDLLAKWSMYDNKLSFYNDVIDYYKQYCDNMELFNVKEYGYNIGEIFYIEYRMNQWLSSVLINHDSLFDTYILFNTRKILEAGMNICAQWKDLNIIVTQIISRLWPDLSILPHPNTCVFPEELVDYEFITCQGAINFSKTLLLNHEYSVVSYNKFLDSRKVNYTVKPHLYSISFGYSDNVIMQGDCVCLIIKKDAKINTNYYIDLTLYNSFHKLSRINDIEYDISINDTVIYKLSTNRFSRPNQIICIFNSRNYSYLNIQVRIHAVNNINNKNYNGLINIHNFLIREENLKQTPLNKPIIFSTYDNVLNNLKES